MRGVELVETRFSDGREATDIKPVFRHPDLTVDDPAYREAPRVPRARGRGRPRHARRLVLPSGSRDLVGQDGHMTFATLSEGAHRRVLAVLAFLRSG